jgi:NADH-ubiquinone oxidoreductase chain 5
MLEIDLFNLINSVQVTYMILIDWVILGFICVVALISSVVMIYSVSYIRSDPHRNKFFVLVIFFVISIFLMVTRPHMIYILLGWDGLGLVSYCLVVYYKN